MEEANPFKETMLLGTFHVALPTFDVYSDIALTMRLYLNEHYKYATSLFIPFLINYVLGWRAWYYGEKQKKYTWIFALLACYPQIVAIKSIWLFWRQPVKGLKGKRHLERNIMGNEVFTEAIPASLVMTFLMVVEVIRGPEKWTGTDYVPNEVYEHLVENGPTLFYATVVTSYLSAGLGLAKCLKVGPCRVLAEGGFLGGLLAPRFLLIFAACVLSIAGKGFALASPFGRGVPAEHTLLVMVTILATIFLPGFLLGVASCWHAAGKAPAAIFPKLSLEPLSAQTSTNLIFWTLTASQSLFLSTRRKTCRVLSWSSQSWWGGWLTRLKGRAKRSRTQWRTS